MNLLANVYDNVLFLIEVMMRITHAFYHVLPYTFITLREISVQNAQFNVWYALIQQVV